MDCLFCRIVQGEVPSDVVHEDADVLAFKDIHPKAPVHILVIPKKHLDSLATTSDDDQALLGKLLQTVRAIAADRQLDGYKTVINTGHSGGQVIDHLHLHLLGGKQFAE
jgi:histidine triad (HIT) family protein